MSPWITHLLDLLDDAREWGYRPQGASHAEPLALAALALAGHGRRDGALRVCEELIRYQADDGSVRADRDAQIARWPTGLAILAWQSVARQGEASAFACPIEKGVRWLIKCRGEVVGDPSGLYGHRSELVGWPWVEGTHSWVEPTAFGVLALKASGQGDHGRVREGVRLLIDRQIPGGGWNYGNRLSLGRSLRPHIEPTGLALLALAGEEVADGTLNEPLGYLRQVLDGEIAPASLSYGVLGLAAHGLASGNAPSQLEAAAQRPDEAHSVYALALLGLAALGPECPLIQLARLEGVT